MVETFSVQPYCLGFFLLFLVPNESKRPWSQGSSSAGSILDVSIWAVWNVLSSFLWMDGFSEPTPFWRTKLIPVQEVSSEVPVDFQVASKLGVSVQCMFVLGLHHPCYPLIMQPLSRKKCGGCLQFGLSCSFYKIRPCLCVAPWHAQETPLLFWYSTTIDMFPPQNVGCLTWFCFVGCEDFWHYLQAENHQCSPRWYKPSPGYVSLQPVLEGHCDAHYWLGNFHQGGFPGLYIKPKSL